MSRRQQRALTMMPIKDVTQDQQRCTRVACMHIYHTCVLPPQALTTGSPDTQVRCAADVTKDGASMAVVILELTRVRLYNAIQW
jgi:hypothetical protein